MAKQMKAILKEKEKIKKYSGRTLNANLSEKLEALQTNLLNLIQASKVGYYK